VAKFGRLGDLHTIAYITGPRHLWLGLKFSPAPVTEPVVVMRPPIGTCNHGPIDPAELVSAVVAAAAEHCMHVSHIEYVENDSPAYSLYAHCARHLVERAGSTEA
jgi:hypothetical protein